MHESLVSVKVFSAATPGEVFCSGGQTRGEAGGSRAQEGGEAHRHLREREGDQDGGADHDHKVLEEVRLQGRPHDRRRRRRRRRRRLLGERLLGVRLLGGRLLGGRLLGGRLPGGRRLGW